jgi:hypothetical protein
LDVALSRTPSALVVPRDAIVMNGDQATIRVRHGSSSETRHISVSAVSAHEALVASGLKAGEVVERNAATRARSR